MGEETIRGDKTWHLSGIETTNAEGTPVATGTSGATTTHVDTWIRESDYYGVRVKMDNWPNTVGSLEEAGLNTPSKATFQIDFSNYDRDITITPPPADQVAGLVPTHHKVGGQVAVDGIWLVTVNSVRTSAGSDYEKPASGNTYLVLNVTMKNQSQQVEDVSTWLQFSLKDDSGQAYSEALTTFTKAAPGGSVEPGGLTRGEFAMRCRHRCTTSPCTSNPRSSVSPSPPGTSRSENGSNRPGGHQVGSASAAPSPPGDQAWEAERKGRDGSLVHLRVVARWHAALE